MNGLQSRNFLLTVLLFTNLLIGTDREKTRAGKARVPLTIQMMKIVTRMQGLLDLGSRGLTMALLLSTLMARRVNTLEATVR